MGESESVSREELIKQFAKARERGWCVDRKYFPKEEVQDFWPLKENIFKALEGIRPENVNYLLLGQDPYPNTDGTGMAYATGIAFDIPKNCNPVPESFDTLISHIDSTLCRTPEDYAQAIRRFRNWIIDHRILMLNSALTVAKGNPTSHLSYWKYFIEGVIQQVREKSGNAKFVAFGDHAGRRMKIGLGGLREFTWVCHPKPRNGDTTFEHFWKDSPVGKELKEKYQSSPS